jgi:hypothetical protein
MSGIARFFSVPLGAHMEPGARRGVSTIGLQYSVLVVLCTIKRKRLHSPTAGYAIEWRPLKVFRIGGRKAVVCCTVLVPFGGIAADIFEFLFFVAVVNVVALDEVMVSE